MQKNSSFFNTTKIYFISLVLFVCVRIFYSVVELNINEKLNDFLSTFVIQVILMVIVPFLLYKKIFKKRVNAFLPNETMTNKEIFEDIKLKKVSFKVVLVSIIIGVIAFLLNIVVSTVFSSIIQGFGYHYGSSAETNYSTLNFLLNVLTVAIMPGICEEFLHRGILLNGLKKDVGVKYALIISSILFGLMHLNVMQVFYAIFLGYIIGLTSIMADSIIPSMIIHFMNNFISTYLSFAVNNGWFMSNFYDKLESALSNLSLMQIFMYIALYLIILVALLIICLNYILKETRQQKAKVLQEKIEQSVTEENEQYKEEKEEILQTIQNVQNEKMSYLDVEKIKETLKDNSAKKLALKDKAFLISTLVLGITITIFTFVWGVMR